MHTKQIRACLARKTTSHIGLTVAGKRSGSIDASLDAPPIKITYTEINSNQSDRSSKPFVSPNRATPPATVRRGTRCNVTVNQRAHPTVFGTAARRQQRAYARNSNGCPAGSVTMAGAAASFPTYVTHIACTTPSTCATRCAR